jgi:hypothetical protein
MSRPSNENEALDQSAQVIVFCAPVQPCRVPIRRPDGTLVLVSGAAGARNRQRHGQPAQHSRHNNTAWRRACACRTSTPALMRASCARAQPPRQDFPSERARFRFKQQCVQTVAANCEQGARCAWGWLPHVWAACRVDPCWCAGLPPGMPRPPQPDHARMHAYGVQGRVLAAGGGRVPRAQVAALAGPGPTCVQRCERSDESAAAGRVKSAAAAVPAP